MADHACIKCKGTIEEQSDSISAMECGKRVFCHRRCADYFIRFDTWYTIICLDYDDVQSNPPKPFTLNVLADSRESAMAAAVARYKPEESPGVCAYRRSYAECA